MSYRIELVPEARSEIKALPGDVRCQALELAGADALPALTRAAGSGHDDARISAIHAIGMMAKKTAGSPCVLPTN